MVSKLPIPASSEAPSSSPDEASQNIWLAGLGAFAQAQAEGTKVFDALVKDGLALQRKTQELAEAQLAEATQRMAEMTAKAAAVTPSSQWDRLGGIFETRVSRALHQLGLPDVSQWQAALARLDALEAEVAQLRRGAAASATPAAPARKRAAAAKRPPASAA